MKKLLPLLVAFALAWPAAAVTKSVTFDVKGWTCGTCAASTRIALKKLEGVQDVKTDHDKMEAVVTYDDAKVTPERMVQAVAKLGYKAAVKAAAAPPASSPRPQSDTALDGPASPERVSFFEVPLECGAAEGLGCGSASKPVLKALERDPKVKEAKINRPGTVLATILTRDKGEECARDPFEELTKIATRHLNQRQLAELRKTAEQGAGALPGEVK